MSGEVRCLFYTRILKSFCNLIFTSGTKDWGLRPPPNDGWLTGLLSELAVPSLLIKERPHRLLCPSRARPQAPLSCALLFSSCYGSAHR